MINHKDFSKRYCKDLTQGITKGYCKKFFMWVYPKKTCKGCLNNSLRLKQLGLDEAIKRSLNDV